jgi:hypothetical protein
VTYAAVLDVEADWYGLDLSGVNVPPLLKDQGGPFDVVGPHVRRLAQARHQLYLTHGPAREMPGSKDLTRLDHEVVALVLWAATGAGARAQVDAAGVDDAVDRVIRRVLGPAGDLNHGGRWFSVGAVTAEPSNPLDALRWSDVIGAAGAAHVVVVRYSVAEITDRS